MVTPTRIRTLNFLPEVFQTPTNAQFLGATLDQIVNPPITKRIEGYIGSRLGYGINANDYYVTEPNKVRTDYQLEPGVVFTKTNESVAKDFISYPGILDALKLEGGIVDNNNRLFNSQFYSWDSFANLDKLINYNQYYWAPKGLPAVTVAAATVYATTDYVVEDQINGYNIRALGASAGSINPTLTLLRGGTYNFIVSQDSQFWIQGEPGVDGYSITQPNLPVRDIYGVSNNGSTQGVVTFTVPFKNAQDDYNFPGNNFTDLICTRPFDTIDGQTLSTVNNIDGITALEGLTVLFYNTGIPNEQGFVSTFFGETNFDINNPEITPSVSILVNQVNGSTLTLASGTTSSWSVGNTITFTGVPIGGVVAGAVYYISDIISSTEFSVSTTLNGTAEVFGVQSGTMTGIINAGLYEGGFYTNVSENFYRITYVGDTENPTLRLIPIESVPDNEKITANYGVQWTNRRFYRNTLGVISLIPYISAPLDTLYYQDGTSPNKVGIIKLIESNTSNTLDVESEILGKKNFTSTNGVVFTNGLKVRFDGDVIPSSYLLGEYYVEGVGTAIELIAVSDLIASEPYTKGDYIPYDTVAFDAGNFDSDLFVPVDPDYITIARNSISKNAWSRGNRWFHVDVINATAQYNNNPDIATIYTQAINKAKRPIIEFYPNLKLFNSGAIGKQAIDFIDTRTKDALSLVAGQQNYYPDVETYTGYDAVIYSSGATIAGSALSSSAATNQITCTSTAGFEVNDQVVFNIWSTYGFAGLTPDAIYYISEIVDNTHFTISAEQNGAVVALEDWPPIPLLPVDFVVTPTSTTIELPASSVVGTFQIGQFVADSTNALPRNTQIVEITESTTITLKVQWSSDSTVTASVGAAIIGTDTTVDNYALFPGAKIVFAADEDVAVRNTIYVAEFSKVSVGQPAVITLTEVYNGSVLPDDQIYVTRGFEHAGTSYWFDGINWTSAQQKATVNQAPLFDIFDDNAISFGDAEVYVGTSFAGCKLFNYGLGDGPDDNILGFPIRYSSVENVGDISFDVSLNTDEFTYVSQNSPVTQKVNTGYVYNYQARDLYTRQLGWQTAVSPSVQYQAFEFKFDLLSPNYTFTCDIPKLDDAETNWPTIQVYVNNVLLTADQYSVVSTDKTTEVTVTEQISTTTLVQVLLLSNEVSNQAYYTVPINLNNNPLNSDITKANIGDIRGHYQSIFTNSPNTSGVMFGPNNFRDLGNLVPYGTRIIQNSASLVLPGAFLRKQNHNLFDALLFNSREYIKFKALLIDTINKTSYQQRFDPSYILDDALDQISASKSEASAFFWSDMLPSKSAFVTNVYTFKNSADTTIYPLSRVYDFTKANYYGVLVYLVRTVQGIVNTTQLVKGVDYTISTDAPSITVTTDLVAGDKIIVKEYNQTYGSYVPNTPTKLGLYPATMPKVLQDSQYMQPTWFIVGHDGSYNKLYGNYNPVTGILTDYRDQALFEFEKRVYNNLKLSGALPIKETEVIPGFFRETDYAYNEILEMYSYNFLNWVGQNRIEYKEQFYNSYDEWTYNYFESGNRIDKKPIEQGFWRGIYQFYYDTTTPNTTPWEMLGFTSQPVWWEDRYGPAPYTSENLILWNDLAEGLNWNNGDSYVMPEYVRPNLLKVIPVDTAGTLLSPLKVIVGNYNSLLFRRDWKIGDDAPAELSYRRSSTWPFDLMKLLALTKPAEFFNLGADLDNYKYNEEFNQYLVNDRSHLVINNIEIYGNGTPKTSYINWIVDYEKQLGVDATTEIKTLLNNLDVRLVYRLAGFSDKTLLKFYVEKGTPNTKNASLLIPDESYSVLLYDNQPFTELTYSGVVIQIRKGGYAVYGNSQNYAYFRTLAPKIDGRWDNTIVEKLEAKTAQNYTTDEVIVPYGTVYSTPQEVAQFLMSYSAWLENKGVKFNEIEFGLEINWLQMVAEFLYWAQIGWEEGSITTLNPAAKSFMFDKDSSIVQPLTMQQSNFILNQDLYPIPNIDLSILRDGTVFNVKPLNEGDTIAYGQFNLTNFEHGIVFDNVTLFDDVIYNLTTGLRQQRILVRGTKTAEWNGTITASGFILNQDNVVEWTKERKYTKGEIVKYKNKYWVALQIVQPQEKFNEKEWRVTDYNEVQKGMLPNSSTRSYESTLYYDSNRANLESDADLLSFSLIGYRPRDYLALADLTDITQINVYQNMIKSKGTLNAVSAFKGATLPQGGIDYEVYENWAINAGTFGGVLNDNFVEFKLNESKLTGNPSIVSLTEGLYTEGSQQEVPLYSIYNYARPVTSANILSVIPNSSPSKVYPDAGYVNFNDVKMAAYFFSNLNQAVNKNGVNVPLTDFYVRDYVWLANYLEKWQVYSPASIGQVISARPNLNGTVTITFNKPHNLTKYQIFAIVNFDVNVDGYHLVTQLLDPYRILINLSLDGSATQEIIGQGIGLQFQQQRVSTPAAINSLPLLSSEFTANTVWVDENADGSWAVFKKELNYKHEQEITKDVSELFGSAVATGNRIGYLVGDQGEGQIYRYVYNDLAKQWVLNQTITNGSSFGAKIARGKDIFVVSEPTSATPKVYVYSLANSKLVDDLLPYQTINAPVGVTNWGTGLAISEDTNWLYVSAVDVNKVYVYRKQNIHTSAGFFKVGQTYTITEVGDTDFEAIGAFTSEAGLSFIATGAGTGTGKATQCSYELSTIIDRIDLSIGDGFGSAVSTDYNGDTLVVSAPNKDFSGSIENWGSAYIYSRAVENVEVQYNSTLGSTQSFALAWTPDQTGSITSTVVNASNEIVCSSTMTSYVGLPVMFTGADFANSGISPDTVYYILSASTNKIKIGLSREGSALTLAAGAVDISVHVQISPLCVCVNGSFVQDNNYGAIGNLFIYTGTLNAGDVISIGGNKFTLVQTLTSSEAPRIGVKYGTGLDVTKSASEILVGAPFQLSSTNQEGAVYRYTNGGGKYGVIIGTSPCNITTTRNLLLNGYYVQLTAGNATHVANTINAAKITNVQASATSDNKLVIQIIDANLALANEKLLLTVTDSNTLTELGISVYTATQTITCPHEQGSTQFGSTVKFNNFDSVVIAAPTGTRYSATTFDYIENSTLDDDTVFDNNATQWIDTSINAGAVYMFDYLPMYNESLINAGQFVYAQSVNNLNQEYGSQPRYGQALDFRDNRVVIGTPNFMPGPVNGQVTTYVNNAGVKDWSVFRSSSPIVDIERVQNTQIFSAETNNTLINLDYLDPMQGKLLGSVRQNIDYVSNIDPAGYNNGLVEQRNMVWGPEQVGQVWFNTYNVRFMNYHQNDVVYNSQYWGTVFPGSDVAVYTWIESNVPPAEYQGNGTPFDSLLYSVKTVLNSSNIVVPVYYFWVRNSNIIDRKRGKTLADSIIEQYIAKPKSSGISYFAPLLPNTFALYNSGEYINANDSVLHIGYASGTSDDPVHNEFTLIRANNPDDFLPGVPKFGTSTVPNYLYDKLLDSISGADELGAVVPDPYLPKAVQSGVLARPRQSFFYNRYLAVKNYLTYANEILAQFPITETRNPSFLYESGEFFDTADYWEFANWWAAGYNDNTKAVLQVPMYADLSTLQVPAGTIVAVADSVNGKSETYRYDGNNVWTRIGLTNGTIRFKTALWDYNSAKLGFGDNFFDTSLFDQYPSTETRYIVRALNEQIYIDDLQIYRNKSLILLFEYIQSESSENQNYLPWLNKTSLVDVAHTIRELRPIEVYQSDNQDFLAGYINEVKPYHVVIKEFVFKYTGTDVYEGSVTDFDLPATYNTGIQKFVTPELVYSSPSGDNQFLPNNAIWGTDSYIDWYNNFGVRLTGQLDYQITKLESYVTLSSNFMSVQNAQGFPINGIITVGDEQIGYSSVDRGLNILIGLTRGVNNTTVSDHYPGEMISIDLPPVLVLDGGRGYTEPPKVTAYVDLTKYPAPRKPAVLEAVMSLDSILSINVIDPGEGYVVAPEIVIDPAAKIYFSGSTVNISLNTIQLYAPYLITGDVVQYKQGTGIGVGGLTDGQWYYIGLLETNPSTVIGLYASYRDAVNDRNRIQLHSAGSSSDNLFNLGAKASAITSSSPIRENNITLRYDRTTYNSKVIDWEAGVYYGAYFAGNYYNSDQVSSSSIKLQSTEPNISSILASAQGIGFEVAAVNDDMQLTWSSFVRKVSGTTDFTSSAPNSITLISLDDGSNNTNASGTTIGFYVGMPIKFSGSVVGGLAVDQIYYVAEIYNQNQFAVSLTENGSVLPLVEATVPVAGMSCFVGEVVDTTRLTINYPGILNVTNTQAITNALTIPINLTGTGGTYGFYTDLPIFFTGNVFGNIRENQVYYVTTVIDGQTFTMSETQNPIITTAVETIAGSNYVVVDSTTGFYRNDPLIFMGTEFGNIVAGQLYYILEVVDGNKLIIADTSGTPLVVTNDTGEMTVTNQKNTVKLSTATGNMTINVSLPVSPGQINGQRFTLYQTSRQYPNINNGQIQNLLERTADAVVGNNQDLVALNIYGEGTQNMSVNMPVIFDSPIGGLLAATTYYVTEIGTIQVKVVNTSGIYLTCENVGDTDSLYVGMPIIFTGTGLGGVVISDLYYVVSIEPDQQRFSISDIPGSSAMVWAVDNGVMNGSGNQYIKVDNLTPLTTEVKTVNLTQTYNPADLPVFDVSYVLGGYRTIITHPGSGFAVGNKIVISGTEIGGTSPRNDLTLTVDAVDTYGGIKKVIRSGKAPDTSNQYYFKVVSATDVEVYYNEQLTLPVPFDEFPFTGFTSANATSTAPNVINVDTTGFVEFDPVIFTGNVPSGIVAGKTYYLYNLTPISVQLLEEPTTIPSPVLLTFGTTTESFTMTKNGSYALLPEPFYFNQSIVKFNNRVYVCTISNNDTEFVFGKWQLLRSDDQRLNAMDRVMGYYQPTDNMPGVDLTQLFYGVTYPNSTYLGNPFEPDQQFTLDTILQDQPFYPTNVNIVSVLWNGIEYITAANIPDALNIPNYSAIVTSANPTGSWNISKLANNNLNLTDIIFAGGMYVMTSRNTATPIFRSNDGVNWTTNGYFTPFGATPFDDTPFDITALNIAGLKMNSVTFRNGLYVAVGDKIVTSTDTYLWSDAYNFLNTYNNQLYGVDAVTASAFTGFIAVGKGQRPDYSTGVTQLVDTNLLFNSVNGIQWTEVNSLTGNGMYGVTSDGTKIVVVGENGIIYTSIDGTVWSGVNETLVLSVNSALNILNVSDTSNFTVGDAIRFTQEFTPIGSGDPIITTTTYYVESIISATQLTITDTVGGSAIALDVNTPVAQTLMYKYPTESTLRDVLYANGMFVAVGDNGTIKTSVDGFVWTTRTTNTTNDLNGVTFNSSENMFVVVGDNNNILTSTDGVVWNNTSVLAVDPTFYNVQGDQFLAGYAPEELVAGVTKDKLTMIVTTRPGTNWPTVEYAHSGFNVVSRTIAPTDASQVAYSFANIVNNPVSMSVYVINGTTQVSTTLYRDIDYTIDWVSQNVILNNPISFAPVKDLLGINIYEVGNGNQLVKSSTLSDPIRYNPQPGWYEIYLSCNYSATRFAGGGIIRPDTITTEVFATATNGITNEITVDSVEGFVLNQPVTFSGGVLGGLVEDEVYIVKTISAINKTITVSLPPLTPTGVAGPVYTLTTDAGLMNAIIQVGTGLVWSEPIVYHNGNKLVYGKIGTITRTKSSNNAITCVTTAGMVVGDPITFCLCVFGGVLVPKQTYYIESIIDANEFTVSETVGGPVVVLTDATGGAQFITNDYSFALTPDGITARIVFAKEYHVETDYITYTLFGETVPDQYDYTLPETQVFESTGVASYSLDNYLGGTNSTNAIVEVDGVRQSLSSYIINAGTQTITFLSSIPASGSTIAVKTFNSTDRQYIHTETSILSGTAVSNIVDINNTITAPIAVTRAIASDSGTNEITAESVEGFAVGQTVIFKGTTFGGIDTDGLVYYVRSVNDLTNKFTIQDSAGTLVTVTTATGNMSVEVGGLPAIRVTTGIPHLFSENDVVTMDGILGAVQLNGRRYYAKVINPTQFDLYTTPYDPAFVPLVPNQPVVETTAYISGGYAWKSGLFTLTTATASETKSTSNRIVVDSTSELIEGTPVYFSETGLIVGETTLSGLVIGQQYFVKSIVNSTEFTISEVRDGDTLVLSDDTGMMGVTQWEQTNVDRLWVTVNGYKVMASNVRLYENNDVGILQVIESGDEVIITSIVPSATPSEEVMLMQVSQDGTPDVYRVNSQSRTWLTRALYDYHDVIYVNDVTRITDVITQNAITPAAIDNQYNIGLTADKRTLTGVTVFNSTTGQYISNAYFDIVIEDLAPIMKIVAGAYISEGDSLVITQLEGNLIYINGEEIRFASVDPIANTINGIERGVNGTGVVPFMANYSEVYGLLSRNLLSPEEYNQTWNSYVYNPTSGDPLQISLTSTAEFLNGDVS